MAKAGIGLTDERRTEYQTLFESCSFVRTDDIQRAVARVSAGRATYELLAAASNNDMPWFAIGCIHWLESNCNFDRHLHNGDPLTARTVRVPANRPPSDAGDPPFSFEISARDALNIEGFTAWNDWSVPGCLFMWEKYNGFGYRFHGVNSPYLWACSQHYRKGLFPRDHVWDPEGISQAVGTAVMLKWMQQHGQL